MTLNEEHRLWVFENEVQEKIFGRKGEEVAGDWGEDYITKSFMICTSNQILSG
jgi:hypothetical protein